MVAESQTKLNELEDLAESGVAYRMHGYYLPKFQEFLDRNPRRMPQGPVPAWGLVYRPPEWSFPTRLLALYGTHRLSAALTVRRIPARLQRTRPTVARSGMERIDRSDQSGRPIRVQASRSTLVGATPHLAGKRTTESNQPARIRSTGSLTLKSVLGGPRRKLVARCTPPR